MSYLILDADFLCYTVSCVFQETYILATHPALPEPVKLANKTALWGRAPKREGGYVAEYNELNFASLKPDEFSYTEHQEPLSLDAAKRSIDTRIQGLLEETGAEYYKGFVGRGEVFRVELSTLLRYKDNRSDAQRPIHLTVLKQYMVDEHNCEWVEALESDDAVSIAGTAAYNSWKKSKKDSDKGIICFQDKDLLQVEGWQYHVGQHNRPTLNTGFGHIRRDGKGKVRGIGRLHLYWQILSSDKSDNFEAACFSDVKWGDVKAYDLLVDCQDDKAALEAMVKGFKTLYPEPKTVVGWRGKPIEIDAIYVLQEMWNMAKMLRSVDEQPTDVKALLTRLKIEH